MSLPGIDTDLPWLCATACLGPPFHTPLTLPRVLILRFFSPIHQVLDRRLPRLPSIPFAVSSSFSLLFFSNEGDSPAALRRVLFLIPFPCPPPLVQEVLPLLTCWILFFPAIFFFRVFRR